MIRSVVTTSTLILMLAVSATSSLAAGFPGFPACPPDAKNDFALITSAVDLGVCGTFVSCTNLDKVDRRITCQFFQADGTSQGSASTIASPGRVIVCGTRFIDPSGIRAVTDVAFAGSFNLRGNGRICSETKKLACHATLSCNFAAGTNITQEPIKIIVKKQKGD